jgi:peptidoglycan/LPS O-acetylase OafA/YrhL
LHRVVAFYAVWPFFGCMGVLLALARLPVFASADTPPSPHPDRLATLDGLRGFLALAVFFHHAAIYHRFLRDGAWVLPPSRFYALFGSVGVLVFFMITGHLFWSRIIGARSRPGWLRLYVGRVFRIGPLYLVAVAGMLAAVFAGTGARLNVPFDQLAGEIGVWLALGLVVGPDVNLHAGTRSILAGVTWTLGYEWIFYLSLPVTALAARGRRAHLPFALAGLAGSLAWTWLLDQPSAFASAPVCVASFSVGMTCASLRATRLVPRLPDAAASVLALALVVAVFAAFPVAYGAGPVILLGLAFCLIASGCTVFGLLVSRAARRLGDVSYGIYLLQGLVLAAVLRPLRAASLASPVQHWALVLACATLLVALATAAHAGVERPGIALGRRVAAALGGAWRPAGRGVAARPRG